MAGLSSAERRPAATASAAWSVAARSKRRSSNPSREKARTTRTPARASRTMVPMRSSLACMETKYGMLQRMTR